MPEEAAAAAAMGEVVVPVVVGEMPLLLAPRSRGLTVAPEELARQEATVVKGEMGPRRAASIFPLAAE